MTPFCLFFSISLTFLRPVNYIISSNGNIDIVIRFACWTKGKYRGGKNIWKRTNSESKRNTARTVPSFDVLFRNLFKNSTCRRFVREQCTSEIRGKWKKKWLSEFILETGMTNWFLCRVLIIDSFFHPPFSSIKLTYL